MDKSGLLSLLIEVKYSIPPSQHRNYHLNTVENYIRFFDQIKLSTDKEIIFNALFEYLTHIRGIQSDLKFEDSLFYFKRFISPLFQFYEREFGFTSYIKPWILLSWYLPIVLLVYFTTKNVWILAVVTILFSAYFFVNQEKKKEGRVQGFKY